MASSPTVATSLLQVGLSLGTVLVAQVLLLRHLPVETIPGVLRSRVELSNRVRPWLIVAAAVMVATGLVLQVV
jgi:hypothetical protein